MTTLDLPCSYLWLTCGILMESIERSIYKIFSFINNATHNRISYMKNNLKHRCNYIHEIKFDFQVLKSWIFNRIPCEKKNTWISFYHRTFCIRNSSQKVTYHSIRKELWNLMRCEQCQVCILQKKKDCIHWL